MRVNLPSLGYGPRAPLAALVALVFTACARPTPSPSVPGLAPPEGARACGVTLPPAGVAEPLAPVVSGDPAQRPPSHLLLEAELPFTRIARELEASVPRRVAEERGRDIGLAGSLDTTVDRGPLRVAYDAASDALVVTTSLHIEARACTSRRGCYASCAPEALARVTAPLALTADYGLQRPRVAVSLVRGCKLSALGGLVQVDVTPMLEQRLAPEARRFEAELARRLPDLRPQLVARWAELSAPRPLPLRAGCLLVRPSGLSQGPSTAAPGGVRLHFLLEASPELRRACDEAPGLHAPLLPPLATAPEAPAAAEVSVGVEVPLTDLERALTGPPPMTLGPRSARVASARVSPDGAEVRVTTGLAGDVCGDVSAHARIEWTGDALGYTHAVVAPAERARLAASRVSAEALEAALEARGRVSPRLTPTLARDALPALAAALSTDDADVRAVVTGARAGGVSLEPAAALASVRIQHKISVTVR